VLLKRGMSSTIKELLMSAEYIVAHGNPNVILCERGIRTFETATRNTCDISAVPVLNELTHLPVMLDPSHATGKRSLVPALARAGVAIGADGLIVEVHPCPEKAVSDGAQSLTLDGFPRHDATRRGAAEARRRSKASSEAKKRAVPLLPCERRRIVPGLLALRHRQAPNPAGRRCAPESGPACAAVHRC
jgi:3-deoxy-D-arabino-heptulosonate 7-phosphate (DAHP) synthase